MARQTEGRVSLFEADRQWSPLESEEALQRIPRGLVGLAMSTEKIESSMSLSHEEAMEPLYDETSFLKKHQTKAQKESGKAIRAITSMVATGLSAPSDKVEKLASCPTQDILERKVEELSGQLTNLAQRSRQQQECWIRSWRRYQPPQFSRFQPCPGPETPRPSPLPLQQCLGMLPCQTCPP